MVISSRPRLVRPYSRLAPAFDSAVGIADFFRSRKAFEGLLRAYAIRFRSAVDLGCGTGLFACYLRRRWGVPVFGVDSSPEMLRVAACRCPDVCWLLQDIRSLSLPGLVELATANTYTLNHFMNPSEMKCAFRRISDHLAPGGYLIFDLLTHRQAWTGGHTYQQIFRTTESKFLHQIRWNPAKRLLSIRIIHFTSRGSPPAIEVYVGRGYSPLEIGRWLQEAGLFLRGIHDAATLRLAYDCPPRVIIVATKGQGVGL